MIAFDTNFLVRAWVSDHPKRAAVVRELLAQESVFIPRTVLLEAERVLRKRHKKPPKQILRLFTDLLAASNVEVENAEEVRRALEWYAQGADFADALHLACCRGAVLQTFDRSFYRAAREAGLAPLLQVWDP